MELPTRPQHEADDDQDSSGKSRKKSKKLPLSTFATFDAGRENKAEKPKPTAFDELLAKLAIKDAAPKAPRGDAETAADADADRRLATEVVADVPGAENTIETAASTDTDGENKWAEYKPDEKDLMGGEFIVHGNRPVAETVVLLRDDVTEHEPTFEFATQSVQLQRQPEQQHQAKAYEAEPAEPTPSHTGGGEVPPTIPPEAPGARPEQPPEPEQPAAAQLLHEALQRTTAETSAPHYVAPGEQVATKDDVEHAVYRAKGVGVGRGVLTGVVVGGMYEHFKHKRRERKTNKRAKKQSKQLDAARQNYDFGIHEHERLQAESGARLHGVEQRFQSTEKRMEEELRRTRQAATETQERLVVPPEHRLETSAWHAIEVDTKTGKAVENPTFEYGQEYHNERAQEAAAARKRASAPGAGGSAAAPADDSSAGGAQGGGIPASSQSPYIPSASMQGSPQSIQRRQDASQGSRPIPPTTTAPLWPWVLALLVVAIALAVVLS